MPEDVDKGDWMKLWCIDYDSMIVSLFVTLFSPPQLTASIVLYLSGDFKGICQLADRILA